MFAQRRIALQGVSSMCTTSELIEKGLMFLYPRINYEEEELPCCPGVNYNKLFTCYFTAEVTCWKKEQDK